MFKKLYNSTVLLALMLHAFDFGLFIVDHIHFQYNGFLFGIYLLSISLIIEVGSVVGTVFFVSLAPFIYTVSDSYFLMKKKQLSYLLRRLFPFGRGLCHAYWAPNFWALYNTADKVLSIAYESHRNDLVGSMTSGLVGDIKHSSLPNIRPVHSIIFAVLAMIPNLTRCAVRCLVPNKSSKQNQRNHSQVFEEFLLVLIVTAWSFFTFGWHVHEKAVLMVLIPLNILALVIRDYRPLAFYTTTIGHFSLLPLIHTNAEQPAVICLFLAYTLFHWLVLFRLAGTVQKPSPLNNVATTWIDRLALIHLIGLGPMLIATRLIAPQLYPRLPFLPLLLTSVYCSIGLCSAWLYLVAWSTSCCWTVGKGGPKTGKVKQS